MPNKNILYNINLENNVSTRGSKWIESNNKLYVYLLFCYLYVLHY